MCSTSCAVRSMMSATGTRMDRITILNKVCMSWVLFPVKLNKCSLGLHKDYVGIKDLQEQQCAAK